MCAYRHLSLSVCVSLHTLPSWLPLSCLAWLKIMDASLSKILNNAKVLAMEIDARFRAATWLMGIQTGIIPIPRTTTAASALGVFSFTGWASATGTGHDCPLWNVGMCRDVSGCACSIDGHDLYLRLRDLNQHELTVVSIGFTFTENRAETARVTWAFVALWCHRWPLAFWFTEHVVSFYCNHFRIARRRTRVPLSAAYLDSIWAPHYSQDCKTVKQQVMAKLLHLWWLCQQILCLAIPRVCKWPTLLWWHLVNR